jgi:two-component system nitrate/nitrite response regulator NarL
MDEERSRSLRLVIADDHPIFREGLRKLLDTESGFTVVAEATDGIEALQAVSDHDPDVLLLDVAMPRLDGLESLAQLTGERPRVVILTAAITESATARAMQLGARGIVLKEVAARQLVADIRRVADGGFVLGGQVFADRATAIERANARSSSFKLTPREQEIVAAVLDGLNNQEIAARLSISIQTVKHHLTSVFDKTGASSRLELALFASHHQLADPA